MLLQPGYCSLIWPIRCRCTTTCGCVRLQWVALPVVPVAWAAFGALLMAAAALTQRLLQPRLYAHRPLALFTSEFARWWLAQRLVGTVNLLFAEQLRGTPVLVWWFRMLVRASHPRCCVICRAALP